MAENLSDLLLNLLLGPVRVLMAKAAGLQLSCGIIKIHSRLEFLGGGHRFENAFLLRVHDKPHRAWGIAFRDNCNLRRKKRVIFAFTAHGEGVPDLISYFYRRPDIVQGEAVSFQDLGVTHSVEICESF